MSADTVPNDDANAAKKAKIARMRRKMVVAMIIAISVVVVIFAVA